MQSTLDGLAQLQLKCRMLEEDRDYHSKLQRESEKEYVHHRSHLDELLRKQRRVHHERETTLTRTLAHLHDEAQMLRRALEESMEQQQRAAERIRREDDAEREAHRLRLRAEIAAVSNEANVREEELARLRREVEELRAQRERKHARVNRLEADQRKLNVQLSNKTKSGGGGKVVHPFLPAGRSDKERTGLPTSQNVHSMAQTWSRAKMRTPGGASPLMRKSPSRPTRTGLVSAELEKRIKNELRLLYRQCTTMASELSHIDPAAADDVNSRSLVPISGKMREIFNQIDAKQRQLNDIRNANTRLSSTDTMDQANIDTDEARLEAEATHAQLLNVLRSSSFVPEN
jgi:hypothetical protein